VINKSNVPSKTASKVTRTNDNIKMDRKEVLGPIEGFSLAMDEVMAGVCEQVNSPLGSIRMGNFLSS
jgi:hypothetical protein